MALVGAGFVQHLAAFPVPMNRIVGIETEYGCLVTDEKAHRGADAWPGAVKNYLFNKAAVGAIDLHYRDYEEPPRNGGFLLNGGRLYLDMGHLEYSSPECLDLRATLQTVESAVSPVSGLP